MAERITLEQWGSNTPYEERKEFGEKLYFWLKGYTGEVIFKVMAKLEDIINDQFTLKLIDELYTRGTAEEDKEKRQISSFVSFCEFEEIKNYEFADIFHHHPLEHSKSYKDILYDMWILH